MTTAELVDFFDEHTRSCNGQECGCGWSWDGNPKHTYSWHMAGLLRAERGRDLQAFKEAVRNG